MTEARIHDALLQEGLKKKSAKSAASFVTIGEPDIAIHKEGNTVSVEKGLSEASKQETKKKVEKTLRIEIDDEAFDRLYGHISHPIEIEKKGHKIAVRMISQFGEESTKVIKIG